MGSWENSLVKIFFLSPSMSGDFLLVAKNAWVRLPRRFSVGSESERVTEVEEAAFELRSFSLLSRN